jgi:hypothetical protein
MEHPKAVGDRSTLAIMLALREMGYGLYVPFGENTRCDLIIENAGRLSRVQCKTGKLSLGAVRFATCSSYAHHPNPKIRSRDYRGEIDLFAVYCPQTGGVYVIPIEDVQLKRMATLRVEPAKNGQKRRIRLAADYEVARLTSDSSTPPYGHVGELGLMSSERPSAHSVERYSRGSPR